MPLFRHKTIPEPAGLSAPVDMDAARRAGEAVTRGDADEANRICEATDNARATAFAAFRYIDADEE